MAYECLSHIWSAICSCLLGFNFQHERRPATLRIQTSSVTTNVEVVPSSFASPPSNKVTYDVFLSFRGRDTRNNFTDHLYTSLKQKGIFTFRDEEELGRGETIGPNLLKAIEESRYVIVVFSQNYVDSSWCLDEIAKIADCMKTMGQKVLPVFYHVEPSDVRRQTGYNFLKAFEKHQKRFRANPYKVQRWREALFQVGSLSGWHLQDGYETNVIQEIVEKILSELNKRISTCKGLVGLDSQLDEMLSYLDIGCLDVRIIGICGMSGIGKSTIAQVVFERIKTHFECACFLENVREELEKQGAVNLQKKLLLNLLKCNVNIQNTIHGKKIMRERLHTKTVLVILDDVDDARQLEPLCDREWYGPGSRIIITSRNVQLVTAVEGDKVYNVHPLTKSEALQLFSMKAFKKDQQHIGEEFLKLSKDFVEYANGLPLAIEVLGASVKGRSVELWLSALDRLKKSPDRKVFNVLKASFEGLEPSEKRIFLDIACFLKGMSIDRVRRILQGSDACCPDLDLKVLQEKSMVFLFGKKLWMHDLMQELGWEVVRQECPDEPGKRSRLWSRDDILDVLKESTGTSEIQSIILLQRPSDDEVVHSNDTFRNMKRLRLLKIFNVKYSGDVKYLSKKLQFLYWDGCPLSSFPSDFQPDYLVELHMPSSCIEQLLTGQRKWSMLRLINLSGSRKLMSTPDFTKVPNLEKLVLQDCTNLVEIHPSLGSLKKLITLNMRNCKSVESIPPFMTLESIQLLRLSLCSGLKEFPEVQGNMNSLLELHLDKTGVEDLPPSIECLTDLTILNLADCKNLLRLPNTIGCLSSLKSLYLTNCSEIDEIPDLNGMKCLETLSIGGTSMRDFSFIIGMTNLQYLYCKGCTCLVSESCKGLASLSSLIRLNLSYCDLSDGAFLNDLSSLTSLRLLDLSGNGFVRLPKGIFQFSRLETLKLSNCRQLQSLPKKFPLSLEYVHAENCTSLMDYPNQIKVLTSLGNRGATIVNSLNSTDSSSLATISRRWKRTKEGFVELHSIHKYTDGKSVDHCMRLTSLEDPREHNDMSSSSDIYPRAEIPKWFGTISTINHISVPIPGHLANDKKWKGFAACAIFSVKGYTALSLIEPDPDFCNYEYKITLETDFIRLKPRVDQLEDSSFGSSSHLLVMFYISSLGFRRWRHWSLNESTVVKALFETTNPSMVVQKCAIRLVYHQDDGWHERIFGRPGVVCVNRFNDPAEFPRLVESLKWEKCVSPLEEESTIMLRRNLESVLPRYLEALSHNSATFNFNVSSGSQGWFKSTVHIDTRSNFTTASIKLPQNLHKSKKWMGLAIFALLAEQVGQTVKDVYYRVYVSLQITGDKSACKKMSRELEHVRPLSEEHHQLLVAYIPRAQVPEESLLRPAIKFHIYVDSPHVKVMRNGFRIVYQKDIQGLADTIIWCMQTEDALELHNKWVVEKWIQLIRFGGGHLKRVAERDSRTPWEKYFQSHSQKYRNWDWSNSRCLYCSFERAEMSKWKWFMPFINQGNSAEFQLPPNLFVDDNWLGFAFCCWTSRDQSQSISLGSDVVLSICLHSDVDINGLFDCTIRIRLTILHLTWFYYIPRTGLGTTWSQCKLATVTARLINYPCLAVHSCALRLVYKEDVEHLVQILTLAELP